jgi:glycine cleavage system pyridoxal-binding protein P
MRATSTFSPAIFKPTDQFEDRHLGPSHKDERDMLKAVGRWRGTEGRYWLMILREVDWWGWSGFSSLDALIDSAVPAQIRLSKPLVLDAPMSER